MRHRDKLRKAKHLILASHGVRGKMAAVRQLWLVAQRSRAGRKAPATTESISANAWADYHLLRLVSRDMNVRIVRDGAARAWFVVPELNAKVIFGGYIALFQFIKFVQDLGIETGVMALSAVPERDAMLKEFEGNALAHGVLSRAKVEAIGVGRTVRLGAKDMLVSYNWTSSLVAARMARFLDDPAYYYFVQEDERIFYPNDSYRYLCESVFHQNPAPRLICNSQKLYEFFLNEGLISPDTIAGVFEQGLPAAELPDREELARRSPRRFGFYGRPEDHAKRNLMSIALLAIAKAKRDGAFDAEPWEFFMLGSSQMGESFDLDGTQITCLKNQGYEAYRKTLATFDAGMCLMYAPHPSVPPFEMVRSGVVTVVNTMRARPAQWYRDISGNFEPAEASVDGLAAAIKRATARVGDTDSRLANTKTYHPESWEQSLAHLPRALQHSIFDDIHQGDVE
jgi:hypothetical protein